MLQFLFIQWRRKDRGGGKDGWRNMGKDRKRRRGMKKRNRDRNGGMKER